MYNAYVLKLCTLTEICIEIHIYLPTLILILFCHIILNFDLIGLSVLMKNDINVRSLEVMLMGYIRFTRS